MKVIKEMLLCPLRLAAVFGEPHLITFDGKDYIFNGYGEYVLLTTKDGTPRALRIEVQGRMEQINETGEISEQCL